MSDQVREVSSPATESAPVVFARACVFVCGGATYGFPVTQIREVAQLTQITPVPRLPSHVRGVANLRGVMVPVVDPAPALGRSAQPLTSVTPTVLLRDGREEVGLAVQAIHGLFPMENVEPAGPAQNASSNFVTGVFRTAEHDVVLLDGQALVEALRPPRLRPPDVI